MAELDFDQRLERMFAAPPHFPDAELFAVKAAERLDRGWTLRRLTIGAAGVLGGLIGVGQMARSGLLGDVERLSSQAVSGVVRGVDGWAHARAALEQLPLRADMVWMPALLVAAAAAFAITRMIEEF